MRNFFLTLLGHMFHLPSHLGNVSYLSAGKLGQLWLRENKLNMSQVEGRQYILRSKELREFCLMTMSNQAHLSHTIPYPTTISCWLREHLMKYKGWVWSCIWAARQKKRRSEAECTLHIGYYDYLGTRPKNSH